MDRPHSLLHRQATGVVIPGRRPSGLSLVELLIALVLGSALTLGVVQLFVANSETYRMLVGQSRMQESVRFAFEIIGRAVRQAGYRGCFSVNAEVHTTIDPEANIPYEFAVRLPVQGYEAGADAAWRPPLVTAAAGGIDSEYVAGGAKGVSKGRNNGIDPEDIQAGTDVLTVRRISQVNHRLAVNMPTSAEPINVVAGSDRVDFATDYLAMIHDCEKGTIFRVTDMPDARRIDLGDHFRIRHDTLDRDRVRNATERLARSGTFLTDAQISSILAETFFVARGAGFNNRGERSLSLWRKSGLNAPVELIEGVEDLQILYGVDTDADQVPNQYRRADQVGDFRNVTALRVSLTVNSVDDVGGSSVPTHGCTFSVDDQQFQSCRDGGGTTDGRLRRTFTRTIAMRNQGR